MRPVASTSVAVVFMSAILAAATAREQETKRIADAAAVLQEIRSAPDKDIPEDLWDNARCVAVIPFAGVNLTSGVLKPDTDDNRGLYGRAVSARAILVDQTVRTPSAAVPFMAALKRTMPPSEKSSSR